MPEDLPKAVIVLLWLLIGLIIAGYLIMAHPLMYSLVFAVIFYGVPIFWNSRKKKEQTQP